MTELRCTAREAHPFWGARKLLAVLQTKHPRIHEWPTPWPIYWRVAGWCSAVAPGARRSMLVSCRPSPTPPMTSGRRTSQAGSAPSITFSATH